MAVKRIRNHSEVGLAGARGISRAQASGLSRQQGGGA
jgi:hypothetical protein